MVAGEISGPWVPAKDQVPAANLPPKARVVSIGGERAPGTPEARKSLPKTSELQKLKQALANPQSPLAARVALVQRFIEGFVYNRSATRHFDTSMDRPLAAILETARYILHGMYHIRCVEAVYAGIALTQNLREVERFPLRFKTHIPSQDQVCRHLVLAVRVPSPVRGALPVWGAIGLSRESTLMTKPCRFDSLHALIQDYVQSYAGCEPSHTVTSVAVGLPVSHDDWSSAPVCWGYVTVHPRLQLLDETRKTLDRHLAPDNLRTLAPLWEKYGRLRISKPTCAHPTALPAAGKTRNCMLTICTTLRRPRPRLVVGAGGTTGIAPEERVDWIDDIVTSIDKHIKKVNGSHGASGAATGNRDGTVQQTRQVDGSGLAIGRTPPRIRQPSLEATPSSPPRLSATPPAPAPEKDRASSVLPPVTNSRQRRAGSSRRSKRPRQPTPGGQRPGTRPNSSRERRGPALVPASAAASIRASAPASSSALGAAAALRSSEAAALRSGEAAGKKSVKMTAWAAGREDARGNPRPRRGPPIKDLTPQW